MIAQYTRNMSAGKRVLVFGGAFYPPTAAHEAILAECLKLPDFDEVWLMPSGDRRDKAVREDDRRLTLLEVVKQVSFADDPRLVVSDFELNLPRPTNTYDTTQSLAQAFPDYAFSYVFGSDSYRDMPHWKRGTELQRDLSIVLVMRGVGSLPERAGITQLTLPVELSRISSTAARQALAEGLPLEGLVSPAIANYLARRASLLQ